MGEVAVKSFQIVPKKQEKTEKMGFSENWESSLILNLIRLKCFDFKKIRTYESANYYKKLLLDAGFAQAEAQSDSDKSEFTFEEAKKYVSGWLPHLAFLKLTQVDLMNFAR